MTGMQEEGGDLALVVGASGFLGRHVTRALAQRGRRVRILVRASSQLADLGELDLDVRHGDVLDPESLRQAMAGCAEVYYCVVDTRAWLADSSPLYRVNVLGVDHAMDAAQHAGVRRFIFTSSIATIGLNPTGIASEEDAFNWGDTAPDYVRFRAEAEANLLNRCREQGFPGVVCCVGNTYGPRDVQPTPHGRLLLLAALGKMPFALDCSSPCVDIRDAAAALLLAASKGRVGERYIIAAEHVCQVDMLRWAAEAGGVRAPMRMPLPVAYALAWVNERIARLFGRSPQLCVASVRLSHIFNRMENRKAREELGWTCRPVREAVEDAVAWYLEHLPRE